MDLKYNYYSRYPPVGTSYSPTYLATFSIYSIYSPTNPATNWLVL